MNTGKFVYFVLAVFMSAVFLAACQNVKESEQKSEEKAGKASPASLKIEQHADTASQIPKEEGALEGKVVETMNSGGYTYALLEKDGVKTWVAVPETKIHVGEDVSFQPGAEMVNFKSNTLKRTFDRIIFSGGLISPQAEGDATGMPMGMYSSPHGGKVPSAPIGDVHVEKASGPNAYTVAELYEKVASLDKKKVKVRGKVVKVLPNIMGKNWIHVQDGSGDPQENTHDFVVTSQDLPSVGDVVTVSGTLYKDKDFGAGYMYKAIIEDASILKQ